MAAALLSEYGRSARPPREVGDRVHSDEHCTVAALDANDGMTGYPDSAQPVQERAQMRSLIH